MKDALGVSEMLLSAAGRRSLRCNQMAPAPHEDLHVIGLDEAPRFLDDKCERRGQLFVVAQDPEIDFMEEPKLSLA